jgi:hypothetical protein
VSRGREKTTTGTGLGERSIFAFYSPANQILRRPLAVVNRQAKSAVKADFFTVHTFTAGLFSQAYISRICRRRCRKVTYTRPRASLLNRNPLKGLP